MSHRRNSSTLRSGSGNARRLIASAAARLMAEHGIADYGIAKRKAARQMGVGDGDALPSNEEIEQELRDYQAIYQEEEQPARLREMRTAALELMAKLEAFRPCLTGAVLDGTAGRYSAAELDLFAESSKDVEIMLLSNNIPYQVDEIQRRYPDSPETRLTLEWHDVPVNLLIYPAASERGGATRSAGSRSRPRARALAVAALLAEQPLLLLPGICSFLPRWASRLPADAERNHRHRAGRSVKMHRSRPDHGHRQMQFNVRMRRPPPCWH
jgi:hypothetical protein